MSSPDYSTKITALEAALASGELTVESDGDRITYRSVKDLTDALAYFRSRQDAVADSLSARAPFGFSAASFCRE